MSTEILKYSLTLPYPPTVNTYYRTYKGRMLLSYEAKQYHKQVKLQMLIDRVRIDAPLTSKLAVMVSVIKPDERRRDLDNLGKALFDTLQKIGIYIDDSQIVRFEVKIDSLNSTKTKYKEQGCAFVNVYEVTESCDA